MQKPVLYVDWNNQTTDGVITLLPYTLKAYTTGAPHDKDGVRKPRYLTAGQEVVISDGKVRADAIVFCDANNRPYGFAVNPLSRRDV